MLLEKRKMQEDERKYLKKLMSDHHKFRQDLEKQKEELESRQQLLQQREFQDESERSKLFAEKKMVI